MSFKTFCFLLLLLALGIWGYFRYEASQNGNTYFNVSQRYSLGKSEFWRTVLNLNRVGDAKGQYLTDTEPTIIEVVTTKGLEINEEGLLRFAGEVQRITGRQASTINVDTISNDQVSDRDLPDLVKNFRRHKQFGQPEIFVVYASDFEGSENGPSKPFYDFGILVSDQKLKDLTSQYAQSVRDYLPAVMLNSFGKQIGLSDTKDINCIMQPGILDPKPTLAFYGTILPYTYCDAEIQQAKNIAENLK